jgi:hypothetical protein
MGYHSASNGGKSSSERTALVGDRPLQPHCRHCYMEAPSRQYGELRELGSQ